MRYLSNASWTTSGLTSPRSARAARAWTTTDGASMWKNRRAAGRVSAKPKPSAPRAWKSPGTHLAIWFGTARM